MPLDPQVVAALERIRAAGNPEYWQMTPAEARDVGEYDPLRDDGIAYARALERAGTSITLSQYDGTVHPFFSMGGAIDAGRLAHAEAAGALRRAFAA